MGAAASVRLKEQLGSSARQRKYAPGASATASERGESKNAKDAAAERARRQEAEDDSSTPQNVAKRRPQMDADADAVEPLDWGVQGARDDRSSPLGIDELVQADELEDRLQPKGTRAAARPQDADTWRPPADGKNAGRGHKTTLVVDQHVVGARSPKKAPATTTSPVGEGSLLSGSALRGLQPQAPPVEPLQMSDVMDDEL